LTVYFPSVITTTGTEENFLKLFQDAFSVQSQLLLEAHRVILSACYRNPGLSPTIKADTPEMLAQKWLKRYQRSYENRISRRRSNPPGTVADPIVNSIISARLAGLNHTHLDQIKFAHRLSMSAENIQGLLLEEFLAKELIEYGWYCCWGETIRDVDFCNIDGSLLQVKNRSNSENSASSRVRVNQPIEKWHRVDANSGRYKWSYFNQKYHTDRFSEENFVSFVQQVLAQNPDALAVELGNPWEELSDLLNQV
jgi:hypothetical protein